MTEVRFYDDPPDERLRFAVIIAVHNGKWVFCRHKTRQTYELPGGRRETGETVVAFGGENDSAAARRELWEETGALEYTLAPVCAYGVTGRSRVNPAGGETLGMLFYAEIRSLGALPPYSEMACVALLDRPPALREAWSYPDIQPLLLREYERRQSGRSEIRSIKNPDKK